MADDFTLNNRKMRSWLVAVLIVTAAIALARPPAFWLCVLGVALLVTGICANSARTSQWMSGQNKASFNWFEGWATSTGSVLIIVPLLTVVARTWIG